MRAIGSRGPWHLSGVRSRLGSLCVLAALISACAEEPSSAGDDDDCCHPPPECESDSDCPPGEACGVDWPGVCSPSCSAPEPDLELCGCAEGPYCPPGATCPGTGCEGGQLCSSGSCIDTLAAEACSASPWLRTESLDAGALDLAVAHSGSAQRLVILRAGSVELVDGDASSELDLEGVDDAVQLVTGDLELDGADELFVSTAEGSVHVFALAGDLVSPLGVLEGIARVDAVGPFVGEPWPDLWTAHEGASSQMHVGLGSLGPLEALDTAPLGLDGEYTRLVDFDADGDVDYLLGRSLYPSEGAVWADPPITLEPSPFAGLLAFVARTQPGSALVVGEHLFLATESELPPRAVHLSVYSNPASGARDAPAGPEILYPGAAERLFETSDGDWVGVERDVVVGLITGSSPCYTQALCSGCELVDAELALGGDPQLDRLATRDLSGEVHLWRLP